MNVFDSLPGCSMARRWPSLCEEFGISRKTGYKIYERYKDAGLPGLIDRSRRPHRHANQLPMAVEKPIVRLKREYPSWGAPKIRERLRQRWPEVQCPAISTVHAVLIAMAWCAVGDGARARRSPARRCTQPVAPNRLVVRRLQRRIPARQSALLLPADDHRFRQPLPARV